MLIKFATRPKIKAKILPCSKMRSLRLRTLEKENTIFKHYPLTGFSSKQTIGIIGEVTEQWAL
jgi:hypothetical protein